jgi:hypothetical protein
VSGRYFCVQDQSLLGCEHNLPRAHVALMDLPQRGRLLSKIWRARANRVEELVGTRRFALQAAEVKTPWLDRD